MGLRRFPRQTGLICIFTDVRLHCVSVNLNILGLVNWFLCNQNCSLLLHGGFYSSVASWVLPNKLHGLIPPQIIFPPLFESLLIQDRFGNDPLNRAWINIFAIPTHELLFLHFSRMCFLDLRDLGAVKVDVVGFLSHHRNVVVMRLVLISESHRSLDTLVLFRVNILLDYDFDVGIRLLNIGCAVDGGDCTFVVIESHLADTRMVELVRRIGLRHLVKS